MAAKLKRDQLPAEKVKNWKTNFEEEKKETFNIKLPKLILQKATYKTLIGENENRVRIYLGLEQSKEDGKYSLCAFAVSAFLLGSGDVYADYETPVYKLEKANIDYSNNTKEVIESIRLYRKWRNGELDANDPRAPYRQYIYPNAYLLTKFELHELFNVQDASEIKVEFGIEKSMSVMLSASARAATRELVADEEDEYFDYAFPCPPYCDERSIYNP
ncbi:MAG TPA: hypothetical protein PK335_01050 [Draconibacterium sp.]|nr:hypothetical protein [Draconibacterium sp.]